MLTTEDTQPESLAGYLAKTLIAKKGYHAGTVPEAYELRAGCDAVLTRANGLTVEIIGIVDREKNPQGQFGLTKEALHRIGLKCLRYCGRSIFRKLPVSITIIEAGSSAIAPEDKTRLRLLKNRLPSSQVFISAWAIDVPQKTLWTNAPLRGRFTLRLFLRSLLEAPRLSAAELAPREKATLPEKRPLYLTYFLLALIAAVFVGEYVFRVSATNGFLDPSIETLLALGALDKSLVIQDGQWWRIFSAPLLHGGLIHIALNGVALFFAGAVLENVIGRAWFAAVFAVSGVGGALMSLLINPQNLISVGASGAIMGLFAAAFSVSYRYAPGSPMRGFLQSGSLRVLIPSLIPLFDGLFGQRIDFAAHIGGAIGGALVGALLIVVWHRQRLLPPYSTFAWALAAAGICGVIYSGTQIANGYAEYNLSSRLIPEEQMPKTASAGKEESALLVTAYPADPRSHMYRALALMDARDAPGAEHEWQAAFADVERLRRFFKPQLKDFIQANLAATLKENGKTAEARNLAKPLCAAKGDVHDEMAREGLCQ
ncbi:MAG: rhomboid family intramembrane serine protease [Rhodomicrobium sp.]